MTVADTINEILLGGLLGMLGQGIRIAVGLKKLNSSNPTDLDNSEFSSNRLLISIFIGFAAGAISLLLKGAPTKPDDKDFILTIMAAGYSGADFIEGVFKTYGPKIDAPKCAKQVAPDDKPSPDANPIL
jgi:hypothetical protein